MSEIPKAERLTTLEQLVNFGKGALRALGRDTTAFTGTPDAEQQVQMGIIEAEQFANPQES